MENTYYSFATLKDKEGIEQLLLESELPSEDIGDHLDDFILAKNNNELMGVVGLEIYDTVALLRSLVVKPEYQGRGIAKELYSRILAYAHLRGAESLYLLTLTAEKFFAKLGFETIDREKLPEAVKETKEFRSLCPSPAACMTKNISNEVWYLPKDVLRLQPTIPGANMWAVALKKSMFTYFEIEPHSRSKCIITKVNRLRWFWKEDYFLRQTERRFRFIPEKSLLYLQTSPMPHIRRKKRLRQWMPGHRCGMTIEVKKSKGENMLPKDHNKAFNHFYKTARHNNILEPKTTLMIHFATAMALGCYP